MKFETGQQAEIKSGFARSDKIMNKLIETEAVMDGPQGVKAGDKIYFKTDVQRHPLTNQVLAAGEVEFVLLPMQLVVAVSKKE
jgi:hypothetical protein